jgi:hypothetical protein
METASAGDTISTWLGICGGIAGLVAFGQSQRTRADQRRLSRRQADLEQDLRLTPSTVAATAPPMPTHVDGYRIQGEPRHEIVRTFGRGTPAVMHEFGSTMTGGEQRVWTMRWRARAPIAVYAGRYDLTPHGPVTIGGCELLGEGVSGRIQGFAHTQPVFVQVDGEESMIEDVAVEVQWWEMAP